MMKYYSIRMKLDEVIKDRDIEQTIMENINRCNNINAFDNLKCFN